MSHFDVLVVGGGPAGCSAATFCARQGRRVALIEQKQFPRHKVCGDVINPHCWPVLDRLGASERLRATGVQKVSGAALVTANGRMVTVPGRLAAMPRSAFDLCLLETARAAGVEVLAPAVAHQVSVGWTVATGEGTYTAPLLIGADGRHSLVARATGLAVAPARWQRTGHVAMQAHFPAPTGLDDRVYLHLYPGGYSGLVRVGPDRLNLCIVTRAVVGGSASNPAELFARTVERNHHFRELGIEPKPLDSWHGAHPLWRPRYRPSGPGIWLVGDALRVVEPFSGQGIFFALRTGELAAAAVADPGLDYAAITRALYRERARTNRWTRRLMYHERLARWAIAGLERCPQALNWLAANVLAE